MSDNNFQRTFQEATEPKLKHHHILKNYSETGDPSTLNTDIMREVRQEHDVEEAVTDDAYQHNTGNGVTHRARANIKLWMAGEQAPEIAALTTLLESAKDIFRHNNTYTISNERNKESIDEIDRTHIRLTSIVTNRDDIGFDFEKNNSSTDRAKFPILMERTQNGFQITRVNKDSILNQHNHEAWVQERLQQIRESLKHEPTLLSLGEFDYPPIVRHDPNAARDYDVQLKKLVDSYHKPLMLVAGTRHSQLNKVETERSNVAEPCDDKTPWFNVARIFVNEHMIDEDKKGSIPIPLAHLKLTSAEKAHERIQGPDGSVIQTYGTKFGIISVLICVDAYVPSVIFSFFHRRLRSEKVDYIIVPAYNKSPKLYYVCQSLSLLCNTVVLLVDSCKSSSDGYPQKIKSAQTALFVNGRTFEDIAKSDPKIGSKITDSVHSNIVTWNLSLDYIQIETMRTNHQMKTGESNKLLASRIDDILPLH